MSSKIGKDVSLGGSKPPKSTSSSHISSSSVTGEIEKLIKTEDNNVIKSDANSSSIGNLSTKETPPAGDDKGAKIVAALGGGVDRDNLPGYIYKDPAPLKWRIFEAVAKTNGQRAFARYWSTLRNFLRGWIPRSDLDEDLVASLGAENVHLHNELVLCLINNAHCRYIPAELMGQVPPSFRSAVVQGTSATEAPPPSSPSRPSPGANASLPFQGKRKEGFLAPKVEVTCRDAPPTAREAKARGKSGEGAFAVAAAPEGGNSLREGSNLGGLSPSRPPSLANRDGSRNNLKPGGGVDENTEEEANEFSEERLAYEIENHFGAGSDVWRPWSRGLEDEKEILRRKRPGSPWPADSGARSAKVPKKHKGALASVEAGAESSRAGASENPSNGENLSTAAAAEPANQAAPIYRSQRVPGARTLAPFLQAVTASQEMKVSHEVCRVMTASVKEYTRRVLEACATVARDGRESRASPSCAVKADGAAASDASNVLTPAHLRAALETTPRLAGPLSSSRTQWRRVAMVAGSQGIAF
ncbi:unnamed protein product [Ascophyllum nodosum]